MVVSPPFGPHTGTSPLSYVCESKPESPSNGPRPAHSLQGIRCLSSSINITQRHLYPLLSLQPTRSLHLHMKLYHWEANKYWSANCSIDFCKFAGPNLSWR